MSLRGEPLEQRATLPDGQVVTVRIGLAEDSYIPRRELDTVVLELWDEGRGEALAGVSTVLSANDVDAARALLREVVAGLEAGSLQPTAGALEPLADSVPPQRAPRLFRRTRARSSSSCSTTTRPGPSRISVRSPGRGSTTASSSTGSSRIS